MRVHTSRPRPRPMSVEHFDPEAILAELRIRLDEAGRFL